MRVNIFLVPLLWLVIAIGLGWPLHLIHRSRSIPALRWALLGAGVLIGALTLRLTGGQAVWLYGNSGTRFGDGMRTLVAEQRRNGTAQDVVIVIHPQSWKGWSYYAFGYTGYPLWTQARPNISADQFIAANTFDDVDFATLARQFPDAPQVWIMALQGTSTEGLGEVFGALEELGFVKTAERSVSFTGVLWRFDRQE